MYDAEKKVTAARTVLMFNPDLKKRYDRAHWIRGKSIRWGTLIYCAFFMLTIYLSFELYWAGVGFPAEWTPMLIMYLINVIVDRFAVKWEARRISDLLQPQQAL